MDDLSTPMLTPSDKGYFFKLFCAVQACCVSVVKIHKNRNSVVNANIKILVIDCGWQIENILKTLLQPVDD